jgi:hypothetical protein
MSNQIANSPVSDRPTNKAVKAERDRPCLRRSHMPTRQHTLMTERPQKKQKEIKETTRFNSDGEKPNKRLRTPAVGRIEHIQAMVGLAWDLPRVRRK